jgi:uncharacterized protein (DUF58 family)
MDYPRVRKREPGRTAGDGVFPVLDDLVRLRFKAQGFSFLPRQPVHSVLAGRHASRLRGRGLNFEELRSYLPGDDIRTIDWKVSARTREPHVRVYTEERDRAVWLVVDQRQPMFFGSRTRMKSVTAAEATALSAWRVLAAGDRVGGVVFGDAGQDIVAPHRSEDRVMQLLGHVVRRGSDLQAEGGPDPRPGALNEALATIEQHARHDCLVVLITDGYGANEETRRRVGRLAQHNDVLTVFVFDPMERDLGAHGRLAFSDGRAQLEADTSSRRLREAFADAFDQRVDTMRRVSRRYDMPWLPVQTTEGVAEQVRALLGHHQSAPRR